ncbi:MAG: hypothetical protein K8T10_21375 [Candidatus Eremiobacteraeota bacterium]|nr:hypothetical protein [Candidatus Eremiobacteraeota bacterium]
MSEYENNKNNSSRSDKNGKSSEVGDSFVRWLLYLRRHCVVVAVTFVLFLAAGTFYTFLSPKYYEAKASFFFPLTSPGGGILDSLGLSGLISASGDLSTYAVSILEGNTVSNNVIDKFGSQIFGKDIKKPRVELLKLLPRYVKIKLEEAKVVEITVETRNPKLSAWVANYYVEEYKRFSKSSNMTLAELHRINMEKQRDKVKKELYGLENKLLAFQNREKVVDPPAELQAMLEYYANIKAMSVVSSVSYSQMNSRLSALRKKFTQQAEKSSSELDYSQLLGNEAISKLYQQLILKEVELAKELQTKTEENPTVMKIQGEINELSGLLKNKVKAHLATVRSDLTPLLIESYAETISQKAKSQALDGVVAELDNRFEEIPDLAYSYRRLNRDVLIKEKLLGYLELEVEKARSEEYKNPNEIQILDEASAPDMYSKPILRWYMLGTVILSFIMALIAAKIADTYQKYRSAIASMEIRNKG